MLQYKYKYIGYNTVTGEIVFLNDYRNLYKIIRFDIRNNNYIETYPIWIATTAYNSRFHSCFNNDMSIIHNSRFYGYMFDESKAVLKTIGKFEIEGEYYVI